MELSFKRKNKTILIRIEGEIDHHTAARLRQQTESALSEMGGKNVIFCFEEVTFMDSSGIGVMIGRYKQLQALGGRLAIACANEKIKEIILLSGLTKLIPVYESMEDALAYTEGRENNGI